MKNELKATIDTITATTPEPEDYTGEGRFAVLRQVPQAERSLFCAG